MKSPLVALNLFIATAACSNAASLFWSFQNAPSGTTGGVTTGAVTVNDGFGTVTTPLITPSAGTGGAGFSYSGGGANYTFNGTNYAASAGNSAPGYSMLWGTNASTSIFTDASFTVSMDTTGLTDLFTRFDVRSASASSSGKPPTTFSSIEYSIGGGAFVLATGLAIPTWANAPGTPFSPQFIDLSSLNAIENQSNVQLRFTFNPGSATSSVTQNIRIDNFLITTDVIPEPSSMAVLGLGALGILGRRRRG